MLAREAGRFHELYVADDDRSFYDAIFVGQRLYRRDLITGDSMQLLSDGEVADMAERFAVEHPDERPLGTDEEGAQHPRTSAMAELRVLDLHEQNLNGVLPILYTFIARADKSITNVTFGSLNSGGVFEEAAPGKKRGSISRIFPIRSDKCTIR